MPSFQVPVLGFADGFLSPFPDSLPQLFLRCLPCAFAFGLFPSNPFSFVHFSSGSGYSASVSSFPLSSRFRLTVASSVLPLYLSASLLFPVLSDLISHVFLPDSCTWPYCLFPFALPCFAPTAVPQVLIFRFHFRYFPPPVHFLSSASFPVLTTWPLFLPFLFLPVSASQWLIRCRPLRFRFFGFPRSL